MSILTVRYRHDDRCRPFFHSRADAEAVANEVRLQLVGAERRALGVADLCAIERLAVNGVQYDLWVDLDHPVHDEAGEAVFGVFEYAPESDPEAVAVSVSPESSGMGPELVLSTFAHELGHALYDGPALVAAHRNRPLGTLDPAQSVRAYRLVTGSHEHLLAASADEEPPTQLRLAEYRANEFMGALLVPRLQLWAAIEETAPALGLAVVHEATLFGDALPGAAHVGWSPESVDNEAHALARALAPQFGVSPRFIEVRMRRYGILPE